MTDAAYTVTDQGSTPLRDCWVLVRRKGGGTVRVTVPLALSTPDAVAEAIDLALTRLPAKPGPDVY